MPVDITFKDSYTKKMDASLYVDAIQDTVSEVAQETMTECQSECPVRTSNLRDSHAVENSEFSATITNSAEYWMYVVYGTSRMASNNYPSRAWNTMISQNRVGEIFKNKLNEKGIDTE